MPTLIEHIERFVFTSKEIHASSSRIPAIRGPFTKAVLETGLGDLARDVDPSEIGLFTLVPATSANLHGHEKDTMNSVKDEIRRVEFHGATPLRKPPNDKGMHSLATKDPEVYAEAALKYIDRYQSIRSMPRARQEALNIIERVAELRNSIEELSGALEKDATDVSALPTIAEEEARIRELESQIKALKEKKRLRGRSRNNSVSSIASTDSPQISSYLKKQRAKGKQRALTVSEPDAVERSFWEGPQTSDARGKARASIAIPANFGDDSLLMDSEVDFAELSVMSSIDDPPPLPRTVSRQQDSGPIIQTVNKSVDDEMKSVMEILDDNTSAMSKRNVLPEENIEEDDDEGDEGEKTIVLPKAPSASTSSTTTVTTPPATPLKATIPETPGNTTISATPATGATPKLKITSETERIVSKIWSTVGELIMPGHPFNTALAATDNKPPRAKETITILQNLSSESISPDSPSSHSTSSFSLDLKRPKANSTGHVTALQILTAHLLLTLLSSPTHSMPLSKLKEALSSKGIGGVSGLSGIGIGLGGQNPETRALYGCVAKRLVKIDRREREQVVRFEI